MGSRSARKRSASMPGDDRVESRSDDDRSLRAAGDRTDADVVQRIAAPHPSASDCAPPRLEYGFERGGPPASGSVIRAAGDTGATCRKATKEERSA